MGAFDRRHLSGVEASGRSVINVRGFDLGGATGIKDSFLNPAEELVGE
ncbi:hypothetical protein [Streptomyces sp. NPDC055632]